MKTGAASVPSSDTPLRRLGRAERSADRGEDLLVAVAVAVADDERRLGEVDDRDALRREVDHNRIRDDVDTCVGHSEPGTRPNLNSPEDVKFAVEPNVAPPG